MDVDELWDCRASSSAAVSMQYSLSEGGDDAWMYFPCPFCYLDVEVPVLCTHLQEEHCFDTKNSVCPMCAANIGRDMIGHFTVRHSNLLKWRKSQKTNLWTNSSASVEKEPHEFSSFLRAASTNKRGNALDSAPDPLLSSFIHNMSFLDRSDREEIPDTASGGASSFHVPRLESSMFNLVSEQDYEERNGRAEFVQQMLLSTIF